MIDTPTDGEAIDDAWLAAVASGQAEARADMSPEVPNAVERMDALLRAWAVGFRSRRPDVATATLQHGPRGLHVDECGSFLQGLDAGYLHVDSAGYITPLCAEPKRGQKKYALCCRSLAGVTVNLEYIIQLGAVAELASLGWPRQRLRVELGEFDAACLDRHGAPQVLMEAKARVHGQDGLVSLVRKWLDLSGEPVVARGGNAANRCVELLRVTQERPTVNVLLVAAGARWWLTAHRDGPYRLTFRTSDVLVPAIE